MSWGRISTRVAPVMQSVRHKSSISALAYKALHRNLKRPPLPTTKTPNWSTNAAISSILYETPEPAKSARKEHILQCLVQNEPGVLSRVSGTLAARGFNIDSLVVSSTAVPDLSRMTIVLKGKAEVIEQMRRQIEDLVPVWAVLDYTDARIVARELLLAKVSLMGPEYFEELVAHHCEAQRIALNQDTKVPAGNFEVGEYHPKNLPLSEALRHKHDHLDAISKLAKHYGGKIADISDRNCIVELCATPEDVTMFLHQVKSFGILEIVRTGLSALTRSPIELENEDEEEYEAPQVDSTDLPPG